MFFHPMDLHLFVPPPLHSIITVFFILILVPSSYSQDYEKYWECAFPYQCGNMTNVQYPFWGNNRPQYCGHKGFELNCTEENHTVIDIGALKFLVLNISQEVHTMRIARMDLWGDVCTPPDFDRIIDTTLNYSLFNYTGTNQNLSLFYDCSSEDQFSSVPYFDCPKKDDDRVYYVNDSTLEIHRKILFQECNNKRIIVPVLNSSLDQLWNGSLSLQDALNKGFDVEYDEVGMECGACENSSRGICGYNSTFLCLCGNKLCQNPGQGMKLRRKLAIGLGAGFGGILLSCIVFFFYLRRKKLHAQSTLLSRDISSDPSSKVDLERQDNLFGAHLFSYTELEEATNNFDCTKELGDGGFGTVYYGKLQDGRAVAVKRLFENNYKRVEQFKNEVEILTRLRHQNLVSLYGCTSRHSRELLLVYEYIPNGTIADHLQGKRAKPGALPWPIRMKIAIETASALTYLHASDIIHRDVKTNNILLDDNFCVKVADFGLSRLFPTDVTHVSTAPQGTPGYVDPEYHQCYQLTDRSDVFSFGVVLIELISSKPAVDITRHRHEINLSTMAINKIQNGELHELVDPFLGFESDYKVRNMINYVAELAFQCLQQGKDMRPSMEQVLESLKKIQSEDYNRAKAEEMDIPSDDVVLLSGQLSLSPVSVNAKWSSTTTTPNDSG